jgi:carbon monoxide dehydrogenase subunit G
MLLYVLYTVFAIVAIALGRAASKPSAFRIERSARINVPPDRIAPHINDFHNWAAWSPWEKMDPALQRSYSGAPSGRGAVYEWQGNKKVGKGRMEITDSQANKVLINLDFIEPFKASNVTEFSLRPDGNGTNVNWAMTGNHAFPMKVFGMFMNMDKMVGNDFEKGLVSLKEIAERPVQG